jgi:hypothetical protein
MVRLSDFNKYWNEKVNILSVCVSGMVTDLVTDPDSFFRRRAENPRLLVSFGIVLLAAILAAVTSYLQPNVIGQVFQQAAQQQGQQLNQSTVQAFASAIGTLATIFSFIGTFISWIIYSIVFYLIARFAFSGDGSFGNTFAFTGWGFVPTVIGNLISVIATYYVFAGVTLPENAEAASEMLTQLQSDPALFVATLIGLVLLLWSGAIWMYAMGHLHDISLRNAAITVWIPVIIDILLGLGGIL